MSSQQSDPLRSVGGVANFRDAGGYKIAVGASTSSDSSVASVRRSFVYRSADPSRLTNTGLAELRALGIGVVFDLRSTPELEKSKTRDPSPLNEAEDIAWIHAPVFASEDYSPEQIAVRYTSYAYGGTEVRLFSARDFSHAQLYRADTGVCSSVQRHTHTRWTCIQEDPAAHPRRAAAAISYCENPLITWSASGLTWTQHCSAGKDRTGLVVAIILSLVGVDDETIATEYQLTERAMYGERDGIVDRLMLHPALKHDREAAVRMTSAKYVSHLMLWRWLTRGHAGKRTCWQP